MNREQLAALLRARIAHLLVDASGDPVREVAIYTLSDPRELREIRYVGQTRAPRRRYSQHVGKARLWLPDELPWWIKVPKERPLYEWIRELHRDGGRLPAMSVVGWHDELRIARAAEKALILAHLERRPRLLNIEVEVSTRPRSRARKAPKTAT